MDYRNERGKMLLSRRNQLLLEFSFWDEPVPRSGPNVYELRSYQLRVTWSFWNMKSVLMLIYCIIILTSAFAPLSK